MEQSEAQNSENKVKMRDLLHQLSQSKFSDPKGDPELVKQIHDQLRSWTPALDEDYMK